MHPDEYRNQAAVEDQHWWYRGKRRLLADLVESVAQSGKQPPLILDIGCGTGAEAAMLSAFGAVVACDMELFAVEATRQRGIRYGLLSAGSTLPFASNSFDLVVASEVFEHVERDRDFVREIARILKPGGRLVFTVPAHPWLYSHHDAMVHHVRRYTRAGIKTLVHDSGLAMARFGAFNVLASVPIVVYRIATKRISPRGGDQTVFHNGPVNALGNFLMAFERLGRGFFSKLFGITYYGTAQKAALPGDRTGDFNHKQ